MVLPTSTPPHDPIVRDWGAYRGRRRRLPRALWLLLGAAALAALGVAIWRAVTPHPWRTGFVRCTYGGYVSGWCSQVDVPEDPLRPKGRTIALRVAVLPATDRPAEGALFYLEGGPGGAASAAAVRVNQLFAEIERGRDVVLVDQRGTGGSSRLACPDERVRATDAAAVAAYVRRCFAHLGRDPRLYTTSVAAADIEAVRRTLGYARIDVYGGSYGATLAQTYARRYPRSVRSVVLDSGSLLGVHLYDRSARNAERALHAVLARCAAERACRAAFPDPARDLADLLARPARRVTVEAGTFLFGPTEIAWAVHALTANNPGALPYALHAAAGGNYLPLARVYASEVGRDLDPRARLAMSWEILCAEPWSPQHGPGYLTAAANDRAELFRRACTAVPAGRVAALVPVSRAPTLLLAGGADPLDPPANVRGWRGVFPNGRLVVVPAAGHGTIASPCVQGIVARFVARGTARGLDAACAHGVAPSPFELP